MRRRKKIRLGQRLSRRQMSRVNEVLSANGCAAVAAGSHGKLPNVAVLLESISGMELGRALHIMQELTVALEQTEMEAAYVQRSK